MCVIGFLLVEAITPENLQDNYLEDGEKAKQNYPPGWGLLGIGAGISVGICFR